MTSFKIISRLTALSSVLSMLFAFRTRSAAAPELEVDGLDSQRAPTLQDSDDEERDESPSWPPPEDIYWGM